MSAWDTAAAAHLLNRAGFGASRGTLERAVRRGREATLDDLFQRREHDQMLMRGIRPMLALEQIESLQAWWMALILRDRAPLVERVALMWHDHFATSNDKVNDVRLMHAQIQLFREKGLGDFRQLMHAIATDPAMLVWLDGNANKAGHPNENFAREVLELFCLGIGNYTEGDIQEAARAFSGWGVDGRAFVFREQYHDKGVKQLFGRKGHLGGTEAIDAILEHPACARHVARKLLEEFTVPHPTDELVAEWAAILVEVDWSIEDTLSRLLRSELFDSPAVRGSRIAGPVELVARTVLALEAKIAPRDAARAAEEMGQSLLRPPSVKGWDGGRTWIHTGSWLARHNHLSKLAAAGGEQVDLGQALGQPSSAREVPQAALAVLLPAGAPAAFRSVLDDAAAAAPDLDEALRRVTALILTAPEYHLI